MDGHERIVRCRCDEEALFAVAKWNFQPYCCGRPPSQADRQLCRDDVSVKAQHEMQVQVHESARKDNLAEAHRLLVSAGISKDLYAPWKILEKRSMAKPLTVLAEDHP